MNRLGLSIGSLFIAALLLYLPSWMDESEEQQKKTGLDALEPTYQAKNLTTKLYDAKGNLTHQVFAREMQHFDQLGFIVFEQPLYTLYSRENTSPWQLNAAEGTLYDNQVIQLENNVTITSLGDDEYVKTIQTEFINVELENQTMASDQEVILSGSRFTITSIGFSADLRSEYYELQNHVKTVYSPVIK
ncbi:LPS export ABC transporter periplasmic protein LptC [Alteromonas sediminis]|uniref:Lipopolysaccharide export system protein LptC n=1 Tax=Alteromonas sediminis TaxID=2259342 RepID=A0A3N5Y2Q9_9ALTE|nr:LPS export ABC transporter periplasmic protein LptC [Alteromonas sediminis]RPJ68062.1 LPS export ABC transporter periplasmic protein LptC [Alteromonas sediminis]